MKIVSAFLCLAVAMGTAACGPKAAAPATRAVAITPSRDVIDIPKLEGITVDGKPDDWGDRGYHVELLNCNARTRPAVKDLDARARIAWSEAGLLVCVTVKDDASNESSDDVNLWLADSVELLPVNRRGGSNVLQVIVAPGGTAEHPASRRNLNGKLADGASAQACQTAATRTADGYVVEALIPWSVLKLSPSMGMEMGFQFYVNDTDNTPVRKKMIWFPKDEAFANTANVNVLRLAETASPPVESLVSVQTNLPYLSVQAVSRKPGMTQLRVFEGSSQLAGSVSLGAPADDRAKSADALVMSALLKHRREVGRATFTDNGDLHVASASVALPPLDSALHDWLVVQEGATTMLSSLDVPDLNVARIGMAERVDYRFSPYVFSGDVFPKGDLENPERMEMLLGPVTIVTRFFDAAFNEVTRPTKPGRYGAFVTITANGLPPMKRFITLFKMNGPIDYDAWKADGRLTLPAELGLNPVFSDSQEVSFLVKERFQSGFSQDGWTGQVLAALAEVSPEDVARSPRSVAIKQEQTWWFDLKKHIGLPTTYPSLVYLPKIPPTDQKVPLIIFLHGSGERGSNLAAIENGGPRKYAKDHPDSPFVVLSLLCPAGEWWNPLQVLANLQQLMTEHPEIDPDRVYLTGLSMGGYGTWSILQTDPSPFAAAVPIAGGGQPVGLEPFKDLPIWVIHGGRDRQVNPKQSYRFVEALRKINGRVRFTLYPKGGHNVWSSTYADPLFYDWLLAQKRGQPSEPRSTVPGTQPTELR